MLAEFIEKLYNNRKKYLYCFLAYVIAATIAGFGLVKGTAILLVSAAGYRLGDEVLNRKIKNRIKDMLND